MAARKKVGPEDFEKLKLLGKGASGRVYLSVKAGTDEVYALKVLSKSELVERGRVRRVFTELKILSQCNHPFVVKFYHAFHSSNRVYFVLEFCGGGELFRVLAAQENNCLPEAHVQFYSAEVALALEHIHSKGFMYRDLKPENILLSNDGHVRIADFDLSARLNLSGSKPQLKRSFVGTPEYLAPEVVTGENQTQGVDWWGFGILMYEMLFGVTPFQTRSMPETFNRITTQDPAFPSNVRVSPECIDLIRKLLCKNPSRRLGARRGAEEVKAHPFFRGVDFANLEHTRAPLIPRMADKIDTRYFPSYPLEDLNSWNDPEEGEDSIQGELFFALSAREEGKVIFGDANLATELQKTMAILDEERAKRKSLETVLEEQQGEDELLRESNIQLKSEVVSLNDTVAELRAKLAAADLKLMQVEGRKNNGENPIRNNGSRVRPSAVNYAEEQEKEGAQGSSGSAGGETDPDPDAGGAATTTSDTGSTSEPLDYLSIAKKWATIIMEACDLEETEGWTVVKKDEDIIVDEHSLSNSSVVCRRGRCPVASDVESVMRVLAESNSLHWGSTVLSARVVEDISDDLKVVHFVVRMPMAFTRPRDFCCLLYSTVEQNGIGVRVFRSIEHPEVPVVSDYVRASMIMGGYVVFPTAGDEETTNFVRGKKYCVVRNIFQVDPKGMVPAWLTNLLMEDHPSHLKQLRSRVETSNKEHKAAVVLQHTFRKLLTPPPSPVVHFTPISSPPALGLSSARSQLKFDDGEITHPSTQHHGKARGDKPEGVPRFIPNMPRSQSTPNPLIDDGDLEIIEGEDSEDDVDRAALAETKASQRKRARRRRRAMGQAAAARDRPEPSDDIPCQPTMLASPVKSKAISILSPGRAGGKPPMSPMTPVGFRTISSSPDAFRLDRMHKHVSELGASPPSQLALPPKGTPLKHKSHARENGGGGATEER